MIDKVNTTQPTQQQIHKYKDPLNNTIPVVMSYSNEVGTAISEIAPKFGTALWIPTFMYLGADIYDKYKNDKDNYDPSAKRALKRAIFQGITSLVALPAVIFAGQSLISPINKLGKNGLSSNTKDAIYKHTREIIDQAPVETLADAEKLKELINNTIENKINARKAEKDTINIFKKIYNLIFTKRYSLLASQKDKILKFAEDNTQKLYKIIDSLKKDDPTNVPKNIYKKYQSILPKMKEIYTNGNYKYQATREAIKKYQNSLIFQNKLLKTIGGLTTLIIFAKPIDNFVEKHIMKKYINPRIDNISINVIENSNIKRTFNILKLRDSTQKTSQTLPTSN